MKKGIRKILVFTAILLSCAISYGGKAEAATSAKLVNGTLTISGTGTYEDRTYEKSNEVKIIRVQEGVNELGSFVFSGCKNLTSVSFSNSLTKIGYETFRNCTSLENVTLSSNLKELRTSAFENCTSLKKITIPKAVTEVEAACFKDSGLTEITFEEGMKAVPGLICDGCSKLTKINFASTITAIGYGSFEGCTSLMDVTLPPALQSISIDAFENCTSLKSIVIPATVTEISVSAFDKGVTLYGAYNSAASEYASENGNPFVVKFKEAKYLKVEAIKAQKHTGKAVTPVVTVKDGNNKLVASKNYKVTYSNNIKPGTAIVTVTGCDGYYVGSVQTKFQIAAKKGKTYTVGKLKYKVTNDSTNKKGTVSVKGLAKNTASVSIPKTVKIGSYSYKVTGIEKKAFYKKSKLKKITVSSTTIKKMGSKAFTGIHKKASFKIPKSKKKAYKKMLYKAGVKKNMKIK